MIQHPENIIRLKQADLVLQGVAFAITVAGWFTIGPFCLYIMAMAQVISCIAWRSRSKDLPRPRSRAVIEKLFFITLALLTIAALPLVTGDGQLLFLMSIALLFAGPPLGIAYFVITWTEIGYYRHRKELQWRQV